MLLTVAPPDNDVLWARALVKSHAGSPALRGVSLGVREGEILAITGPRGCGKTTLLNCLSGLVLPDEGGIWFNSVPVHSLSTARRERLRRERFGWVGTRPQLVPELTAWENAALPLLLSGMPHKRAKATAYTWLERLDVADIGRTRPHRLLRSQQQRVAVARALVTQPIVLFADEPTAPLHRAEGGQVLRTLTAACRSHRITIVLTTNDDDIATHADRVVTMADGRRSGGEPVPVPSTISTGAPGAPQQARATGTAGTAQRAVSGLKGANRCSASA